MIEAPLLVILHAVIDAYLIRLYMRGKTRYMIDHSWEAKVFLAVTLPGVMITQNPLFIVLCFGWRYGIFDYVLNLFRGLPWDYLGDDEGDAVTDDFKQMMPIWLRILSELVAVISACWLYLQY